MRTIPPPRSSTRTCRQIPPLGGCPDRLPEAVANLTTPIWIFDIERKRILGANPAAQRLWRAQSENELRSRDFSSDMSPAVERRLNQYKEDFLREDLHFSEVWTLYPQGEPVSLRVIFTGFPLRDGRMGMMCEALAEVRETPEISRSIDALLRTSVMITLADAQGNPLYRNPAARTSVASSRFNLRNRFVHEADFVKVQRALALEDEIRIVAEVETARGVRWHELTASRCRDAVTGNAAILVSEIDITEMRDAERRATFLAYRDPLTQLANRTSILQEWERHMACMPVPRKRSSALLFIDLDKFKDINDSFGHGAGDRVLVETARRISRIVRRTDLVGRLGGDEFVVLFQCFDDVAVVQKAADDILAAITRPIKLENATLRITGSIGVCPLPADQFSIDELIKNADIAMYEAKSLGRSCVVWYTPEMATRARKRLDLENSLREAVARQEFTVVYQPRVCVQSNRIIGAEALVRWRKPDGTLVSPIEFIPVCEGIGIIHQVTLQVMEAAVRQQMFWREHGYRIKMAVNLSAHELEMEGHIRALMALVEQAGASPEDFEMEITESSILEDSEATKASLAGLRAAGFSVAIDDFGTGYSNLAYMQRYPITSLKIDRSFIRDIPQASAIAEMIIAMCRLLDLRVVAEGIETAEQLDWLRGHGCVEYQGYYFSPPVDPVGFMRILLENATKVATGAYGALPAPDRATRNGMRKRGECIPVKAAG